MKQVWKYILRPGENTIKMPERAKVVHVAAQRDEVCLWALVDPSAPEEVRRFMPVATGEPINDETQDVTYIGTVHLLKTGLVFHVFEVLP